MNTIIFLPSNEINVQKNRVLLTEIKDAGYRILILCIDEMMADAITTHQSIIESGFEYLCVSADNFRRNSHWFVQSFQKNLIASRLKIVFDSEMPILLLTAFDGGTVPYWISKEFQKRNVPVVLVPDGMVLQESQRYTVTAYFVVKRFIGRIIKKLCGVGDVRGSSAPDYVMLLNASGIGAFAEFGITSDRIHVVGAPEYENLENDNHHCLSNQRSRAKIYSDLAIIPNRPFIFFAHQANFGLSEKQMFELVLTMASVARHSGASLVVKFHHRSEHEMEDWENWRDAVNFTDQEVIFADYRLQSVDILNEALLCITAYSTVGLEALFCKTPLIVIKFLNAPYELQFAEQYDCAWNVDSLDQLEEAITLLLNDQTKRNHFIQNGLRALKTEVALGDKSSIERSVELIQRVAAKGE